VDVRLVAATHRDLAQLVSRNEFRSDLYYRLNVFPVLLPPLRERREDIVPLAMHYTDVFSQRIGKRIEYIPPEILAAFESYRWPGNIRELQNLIERAVILSNDGVLPNPLPPSLQPKTVSHFPQQTTLLESERTLILQALDKADWIVGGTAGAAAKLGLKRTTLISKMKKLGISRPGRQPRTGMLGAESRNGLLPTT
jgi:formate hydrogenlyase transcriptional activator